MTDLRLACLYSYGCRMATEKNVNHILLDCIEDRGNFSPKEIEEAIQQLQSYPAYRIIAMSIKTDDVFDDAVIHSYWLGGSEVNHNLATLEKIKLFKNISQEKVRRLLNCAISSGEVVSISSEKIEVLETAIALMGEKIDLIKKRRSVDARFLGNNKVNKCDLVSIHIGLAREIITGQQASVLAKKTLESITALAL
jgi:hypothetical protein